jgi:hypothetical protein
MKKSEALKQRRKLVKLVEQWTRAEIMARLGGFRNLDFVDYSLKKVEKENEIRELLFGNSNLVELGEYWGLLKPRKEQK